MDNDISVISQHSMATDTWRARADGGGKTFYAESYSRDEARAKARKGLEDLLGKETEESSTSFFDFGDAIRALKDGKKVARKGWNGNDMFVYYVPTSSYPVSRNNLGTMGGLFPDDMVPYREYLALKTAQNDVSTWAPSVSDALAEDWQLIK